jgi:predicted ArsR family transcriptional regulator
MDQRLSNADVIRAIGLDGSISPTSKYTLIICVHVCMDWQNRHGLISADQIAEATNQSSRQVKRQLKALIEAEWIARHAEKRGPGLHHKSMTRLNMAKVKEVLARAKSVTADVTELVSHDVTELVSHDVTELVSHDVTELVSHDVTELVDAKSVTKTVTELVSHDVTELVKPLPKVSHSSISLNNHNQSIINEAEPETESAREAEEERRAMMWDQIMAKAEELPPPPPPPTMSQREDGLYILSHINDDLEYRRDVYREITHHKRQDIRDALWARGNDELFIKMMGELIAPRSAIDWVTSIASGHKPSISTPPAPPPKPTSWTVTVDQQQKIKEADRAWLSADYGQDKKNGGWH